MGGRSLQLFQDFKQGLRALRRSAGFTVVTVAVLSAAIGANTAMFSVIAGVLLRPLPYHDAGRLCVLWKSIPERNIEWDWTSAGTIRDWREQARSFEGIALILRPEGSRVTMRDSAGAVKIQGAIVSGNFFDVIGARALMGRTFLEDEVRSGENVVVLSYRMWQERFGGRRDVLGKAIRIDDRSAGIIGVMPRAFEFPDSRAQMWLLLNADPRWPKFQMPRFRIADAFCGLARLRSGVTLAQARVEMNAIAARLANQYPSTDKGLGVRVAPLFEQIAAPRVQRVLWSLGAAVLCVLLIACSNVGSMMIARGTARGREFAIRAALGAGQARLVRQVAMEGGLLVAGGGAGGVLLAYAGLNSLMAIAPPDLPRSDGIMVNAGVLLFSIGLCLVAVIAVSLISVWRMTRVETLHFGARGLSASARSQTARSALVMVQYALAIVLLSGAGLLIRSLLLLNSVDRGFDPSHLLTVEVSLPDGRYQQYMRGQAYFDEVVQRLNALPGVAGAAEGLGVFEPFLGNAPNENIVVEGRPFGNGSTLHARSVVGESYFRVMGIPLRQGRLFSSQDREGAPAVAVINESMARHFWPFESALGKRFKEVLPGTDGEWMTVIGVVGDAIYSREGAATPMFYRPSTQSYATERSLVVRTSVEPETLVATVRRAVQSVDATVPEAKVATVEGQLAEQDKPRRFQASVIELFACIALLLAATGLYGLTAYAVEQRRKEIGIRMALGSTSVSVARLVLRQGGAWAGGGMVIGAAGAVAFGRVLSSSLYGVTAMDPMALTAASAVLVIAMAAALVAPTVRACRVDPVVALREE